jgi:hypothetical protein
VLDRSLPGSAPAGPAALREALIEALALPDVARVRELVTGALADGAPADEVFVEAVRPALHDARAGWPALERPDRERLALTVLSTAFARMAALDEELGHGAGRRAVVVGESAGTDGLDTQVLTELLESAGWMITTMAPDTPQAEWLIDRLEPAAVVLVGEAPRRSAWPALCRTLRRTGLAPIVVLCRFDGDAFAPAPLPEGIDEFVDRPAAALALLRTRFSADAPPAWGVVLRRDDDTLLVTPSGRLDTDTAARLREVIESRAGSFERLVLDLRDLSAADERALSSVLDWVQDNGWQAPRLTSVAGG